MEALLRAKSFDELLVALHRFALEDDLFCTSVTRALKAPPGSAGKTIAVIFINNRSDGVKLEAKTTMKTSISASRKFASSMTPEINDAKIGFASTVQAPGLFAAAKFDARFEWELQVPDRSINPHRSIVIEATVDPVKSNFRYNVFDYIVDREVKFHQKRWLRGDRFQDPKGIKHVLKLYWSDESYGSRVGEVKELEEDVRICFCSAMSGLLIATPMEKTSPGEPLLLLNSINELNEVFDISSDGSGFYWIRSVMTGYFWEVQKDGINGCEICLCERSENDKQKFALKQVEDGSFIIIPKVSISKPVPQVVDVINWGLASGDNLQMWDLKYWYSQRWIICLASK
jgi:hypothetical protein